MLLNLLASVRRDLSETTLRANMSPMISLSSETVSPGNCATTPLVHRTRRLPIRETSCPDWLLRNVRSKLRSRHAKTKMALMRVLRSLAPATVNAGSST